MSKLVGIYPDGPVFLFSEFNLPDRGYNSATRRCGQRSHGQGSRCGPFSYGEEGREGSGRCVLLTCYEELLLGIVCTGSSKSCWPSIYRRYVVKHVHPHLNPITARTIRIFLQTNTIGLVLSFLLIHRQLYDLLRRASEYNRKGFLHFLYPLVGGGDMKLPNDILLATFI